ncbi:MAG: PHP domain-containing protein [Armatimonadota bacterium]
MSSRLDLHVHTTASDGTLSPAAAVRAALANGLTILGIADHDTTAGLGEARQAAANTGLTVVPGVELSVGQDARETHVLGYFIDPEEPRLQQVLATLRGARDGRNEAIVQRLKQLGAPISLDRVREIAGGESVGRPHIAKALVEAGHVSSEGEAFGRYLARGKPGYVGRERLTPAEAASAIRQAGGIPVLAHPAKLGSRRIIEDLLDQGMAGIEVYHSDHTDADADMLLALARERHLVVTGGTDSHGPHSDRPIEIGSLDIPEWVGEQLLASAPPGWAAR